VTVNLPIRLGLTTFCPNRQVLGQQILDHLGVVDATDDTEVGTAARLGDSQHSPWPPTGDSRVT